MKKSLLIRAGVIGLCTALVLLSFHCVWSIESPGLALSVHTGGNQHQFLLGKPIQLKLVVKNVAGAPVFTEKGFSQIELHRALAVTEPGGYTYSLDKGALEHIMPPPFYWKGENWVPAESLPGDFVQSQTINDITDLVLAMKTTPGWYAFELRQQFIRFAKTEIHTGIGLLGALGDPENWTGTLYSQKVQVFVSPDLGAQLGVKVIERGISEEKPLSQIPVRLFDLDSVPPGYDVEQLWLQEAPILTGTTDFQGRTVWQGGSACQPIPQDKYMAIAYYQGRYQSTSFKAQEEGWADGCSAILENTIAFGEAATPALSDFSVIALNSIWVKANAVISSGHIGVLDASSGLWLDSGVEVSIGLNARAEDGVRIYGDSVKLLPGTSVDDVYYNDIQNSGTIRGEAVTPLGLPLPVDFPPFPEITHGTKDVKVRTGKTTTLSAGNYRDVTVGIRGTLRLKEGVYHFRNLNIGAGSQLVCLGPGSTEIGIKQRLYPGMSAKIGPSDDSNLSAKDVVFYIEGTNGNLWDLFSYPRAAEIGPRSEVKANIYVPNGTLAIDAGSEATGAFVAQGVVVGIGTRIELESGF